MMTQVVGGSSAWPVNWLDMYTHTDDQKTPDDKLVAWKQPSKQMQ
jgi:hypothetical protein